jgi:hypothetical protein
VITLRDDQSAFHQAWDSPGINAKAATMSRTGFLIRLMLEIFIVQVSQCLITNKLQMDVAWSIHSEIFSDD